MKKKLLLIYNKIWPYRLRIFELLNKKYDVTVCYVDEKYKPEKNQGDFKTLFTPVKKFGPFLFHNDLYKLTKHYDAVLGLADIKWLSLMKLGFIKKRKFALIYWGIGVRASYKNKFDQPTLWNRIRIFLLNRADALIFYSDYPVEKYIQAGVKKEKLFVAHNTVFAPEHDIKIQRKNLLFIGSLYKQKGIDILIKAYSSLLKEGFECLPLNIVGGGAEYENIKNMIKEEKLDDYIKLSGPVYDQGQLETIFKSSVASISPRQAGLSVLSCMAHGVVFLTSKDAITGGEILNIKDNDTGLFYDGTESDLKNKMKYVCSNPEEMNRISKNAYDHYRNNRTPEMMADSIADAVEYSIKKTIG